jgi:FkbM family methyltransferase
MLISYAQNFEDVILWRALKHVDRGFYIDIGAQDPVVDSVSLAFYEKGWRGVHVEPIAAYAERLRQARPDETVVQAAVGTSAHTIAFWDFPDTGLSTGDPATAKMHERDNRKGMHIEVPCIRLSTILSDYRNRDIHWLKIDVEGMEREVIQSWRPAKPRPWIIVVESTKPLSTKIAFADWEPLLVRLGYEFVYFDGVNRFYVSCKHPELNTHFGPGPNFFDDFALSPTAPYCARSNAEAARFCEQATASAEEAAILSRRMNELRAEATLQTKTFAKAVAVCENVIEGLTSRAKSLESDLLTRMEVLAARDAELVRTSEALAARGAELVRTTEALAAREAELARTNEALAARDAEIVGTNETLAARDAELARTSEALSARNAELARTSEALTANNAWAKSLEADVIAKNERLAVVYASTSWRITAPLRLASRAVRRLDPDLRMMLSPPEAPGDAKNHKAETPSDVSPWARRVYAELKAAIAKREGSR